MPERVTETLPERLRKHPVQDRVEGRVGIQHGEGYGRQVVHDVTGVRVPEEDDKLKVIGEHTDGERQQHHDEQADHPPAGGKHPLGVHSVVHAHAPGGGAIVAEHVVLLRGSDVTVF